MTCRNDSRKVCLFCYERAANAARGLCRRCYADPTIRERFAPVGGQGNRMEDGYGSLPEAPMPTDSLPGSAERMAVYQARAERGYSLFHPGDRRESLA